MKPYYHDEAAGITIYHGDALEVMPHIVGGFDSVAMDPPYGVSFSGHTASTRTWFGMKGDDGANDIRAILALQMPVLSFGANCYPDQLPHRGRWLCWDKRTIDGACDTMLGSPFELAWCNRTSGYDKMVRVLHGGVVNADGGRRVHPTQKPVSVMVEAIRWACPDTQTILDPFMGSGTTLRAAKDLGRKAIGIEIEERYCEIAANRMKQGVLFPAQ